MKHSPNRIPRPPREAILTFGAGVLLALCTFFLRSFEDRFVLFFNDGPLGLLASDAMQAGSHGAGLLSGYWFNLNWLGAFSGHAIAIISTLINAPHPTIMSVARWYFPASGLVLVSCAWFGFRRLGMPHPVAILAGFALFLSGTVFTLGAWGLSARLIMHGIVIVALGLLVGGDERRTWVRLVLGGMAVGLAVSESGDVGAIFSIVVAAAVVADALSREGNRERNLALGVGRVAIVAACAAWIAWHAVGGLVSTQIVGIAGTAQDAQTREQRWDFATGWSFPKLETLRLLIPGVMGYRMDSPDGGAYWGGIGPDGDPRHRFCGGAYYLGVLVLLVAAWAVVRAVSKAPGQPFSRRERGMIFFWAGASVVALLIAFGRHAPFYRIIYALPYFSTVRVPAKWVDVTTLGVAMLFGYGLTGIWKMFVDVQMPVQPGWTAHLQSWWRKAPFHQRRFLTAAGLVLGASILSAMVYSGSRPQLERFIAAIGFGPDEAKLMAGASIMQVWKYCLVFVISLALLASLLSGWFSGGRKWLGFALVAGFIFFDLARGNLPWVLYYDWKVRYQSNPVVDFLKQTPWEQRVTAYINPMRAGSLGAGLESRQDLSRAWPSVHNLWLEHHFQFFNIQSLDIIQMPRMPELDQSYMDNFRFTSRETMWLTRRLWELTNTRYLLGARGIERQLNPVTDPQLNRFRSILPFSISAKPDAPPGLGRTPSEQLDQLTAVADTNGPLAVVEFTGALPRARLFTQWEVQTNDTAVLARLRDPAWDPHESVLVNVTPPGLKASGTNAASAQATVKSYAPKHIVVNTQSPADAILLLNERWYQHWHVQIDGKPAELLRANYLMRGVAVPAGKHEITFVFNAPPTGLPITISALVAGSALLAFSAAKSMTGRPRTEGAPQP